MKSYWVLYFPFHKFIRNSNFKTYYSIKMCTFWNIFIEHKLFWLDFTGTFSIFIVLQWGPLTYNMLFVNAFFLNIIHKLKPCNNAAHCCYTSDFTPWSKLNSSLAHLTFQIFLPEINFYCSIFRPLCFTQHIFVNKEKHKLFYLCA